MEKLTVTSAPETAQFGFFLEVTLCTPQIKGSGGRERGPAGQSRVQEGGWGVPGQAGLLCPVASSSSQVDLACSGCSRLREPWAPLTEPSPPPGTEFSAAHTYSFIQPCKVGVGSSPLYRQRN